MSKEQAKEFTTNIFGIVTDYVLDEVQQAKIGYIVNGFVNLASVEDIAEDFMLNYYDTLNSLRIADLRILKYEYNSAIGKDYEENMLSILEELKIDRTQYYEIQYKLKRMGLLISKNEENERSNQELLKERVIELNQRNIQRFGFQWNDITSKDQFKLSEYGFMFMKFFIDEY